MPVNSANTQLQCPEFMGFLLCSPPAVAPLYDLKVNTCVIFHKISNNNMSVRSETQCLWDLTMLGGRNLFKKKEKKKKKAPTIQRRWLFSLSLFFSEPAQPRFYSPQQFIPLTAKRSKKCRRRADSLFWRWMQMRGGFFFFWSVWVRSINLGRVSSQKPLLAALSSGDVMRRERGSGGGGESPEHPDPQG